MISASPWTVPAQLEKADRGNPNHVAAPFAGVVTVGVSVGDEVAAGQTVATIEAIEMETAITAPTVQRRAGRSVRDRSGRRR